MVKAFEASQEKLFFGTRINVKKHEGFGWLIFCFSTEYINVNIVV